MLEQTLDRAEQAEAERNALALEVKALRERLSECGIGLIGGDA